MLKLTLFDSKTRFNDINRQIDSPFLRFTLCWAVTSAKLSEQWIIYLCVTSATYLYCILSFTVYAGGATCDHTHCPNQTPESIREGDSYKFKSCPARQGF